MYYRFSKYSKLYYWEYNFIILFARCMDLHIYQVLRVSSINRKLYGTIWLIRIDAIRMLSQEGVKLYIGYLFPYIGTMTNIGAIVTLIWYKN